MKINVVLNAGSGTLRDLEMRQLGATLREAFGAAGHEIVSISPSDRPIDESLKEAAENESDCLLVGGGDGSVSAATALAWKSGKVLAVLFAIGDLYRTLRWPPGLSAESLAPGMLGAAAVMLPSAGLLPSPPSRSPCRPTFSCRSCWCSRRRSSSPGSSSCCWCCNDAGD